MKRLFLAMLLVGFVSVFMLLSRNNFVQHTLYEVIRGERLPLTPTEYGLLEILAKSPGRPVPIAQLVQEGLGYAANDLQAQETLRVHISRLRRKLGVDYIVITSYSIHYTKLYE